MNTMPLVSVVVPVYNVRDYLEACLSSLVRQTYQNIQIIVVNDGSTDGSEKICVKYARQDGRVKILHQVNGGLSSARNAGIKAARGEYVCLVDGDDCVELDFVEKLVWAVVKYKTDIAVCGYNEVHPKTEVMSGEEATIKLLTRQENADVVAWNKIYRRGLFIDNGIIYPEGEKHEDSLTTYKLYAAAKKVAYESEALYHYVERQGSIMRDVRLVERLEAREKAAREGVEYFYDNQRLRQAAEIAVVLAKFAFMDAAIRGGISKKYFESGVRWVRRHAKEIRVNEFASKKLKTYIKMCETPGGLAYRAFREVKHE